MWRKFPPVRKHKENTRYLITSSFYSQQTQDGDSPKLSFTIAHLLPIPPVLHTISPSLTSIPYLLTIFLPSFLPPFPPFHMEKFLYFIRGDAKE